MNYIKFITVIFVFIPSFTFAFIPQIVSPKKYYNPYTLNIYMDEEDRYDNSKTSYYFKKHKYKSNIPKNSNYESYVEYMAQRRALYREKFGKKVDYKYNRSEETDN
tara:strand:- start:5175 stop:5492 length:318 start_codon:yes stop_codon:yes gene_type:complete